jgi:hypothetical protein
MIRQKNYFRINVGYGIYHGANPDSKVEQDEKIYLEEHSDLILATVGFTRGNVAGVITKLHMKREYSWSRLWATVKCFQKGKAPYMKECPIRSLYKMKEYVAEIKTEIASAEENLTALDDYYNTP